MKSVFVVAGDAGGATPLLPVIEKLRTAGLDPVLAGYATAPNIWRARGEAVSELPPGLTQAQAAELLRARAPALLLAGTSVNPHNLEQLFILAARGLGIPSLSLLDFWSNYAPRFSREGGRLNCLPEAIAVMDGQAASEMVAEGFPPEMLHVTGQPLFDSLAGLRDGFGPERRRELRAALGVAEGEKLLAFACQPLNDVFPEGARAAIGYDEWDVLPTVEAAFAALRGGTPARLVLLPHPREPEGKYDALAAKPGVALAPAGTPSREVVLAADLLLGMNSVLLMESVLLGTPALSVQPGLCAPDALPASRLGVIPRIEKTEELPGAMERLLAPGARGAQQMAMPQDAAARVAELALRLAGR